MYYTGHAIEHHINKPAQLVPLRAGRFSIIHPKFYEQKKVIRRFSGSRHDYLQNKKHYRKQTKLERAKLIEIASLPVKYVDI